MSVQDEPADRSPDDADDDLERTSGTPGGSATGRFADEVDADPRAVFDDAPAGAWALGGSGEWLVGRELERLTPHWYITHDVAVGQRGANLDHVLVGPPGVFVLNSKYHGDKPVLVDGEVFVGGRHRAHVRQGEREAARASRALSRALGEPVVAVSLIVVVASFYECPKQPSSRSVRVVHARQAVPFLTGLEPAIPPAVVRRLTRLVRRPSTWR